MSKLPTGFAHYAVTAAMGVQLHAGQRLVLTSKQQDRMEGLFKAHDDDGHVLTGSAGFKRGEEIALFGDVPKALLELIKKPGAKPKLSKRRIALNKQAAELGIEVAADTSDDDLEKAIADKKESGGGEG